jgi:hypothetical protein
MKLIKTLLDFYKFGRKHKVQQLGRWNLDKSNIKSLLANIDSCGDTMCGNPKYYKQNMDKIIKEEKQTIKDNLN